MKLSKLYIKIFLSFLLVLVVTEVLIFGLFIHGIRGGVRSRIRNMDRTINAHVLIAKEMVEKRIKSIPEEASLSENQPLEDIIRRIGEAYLAKVWLVGPDGTPLLKSFDGEIPKDFSRIDIGKLKDFGPYRMHRSLNRRRRLHAFIPTKLGRGREGGGLHVLFERWHTDGSESRFAWGLVGIGVVIALLVIPVSRLITKRVKLLGHSALRIAEGDLSHRAAIKGKDEIGELGRAFNRMADKLERMIRGGRELTANISHELRSPLTRIRIAQQLLKEKMEQDSYPDGERYLLEIREDIESLDHLIGRILDLSKLDMHETPLNLETFDPAVLIEELLERFGPAIEHKKLHLEKNLPLHLSCFGDKEALNTAFSNLLENAFKYTSETGRVFVSIRREDESLIICVTNTFPELSDEDLARIFEPFYRSRRTPETGSGLGLAITKKITEKHYGKIEAFNSAEGLEIRILLPL